MTFPVDALTGNPFATPADLGNWLQLPIADDDPTSLLLLQQASDSIREDLWLTVDYVENDTITMYGDYSSLLVLPERPVTAVSSVVIAGESLSPVQVGNVSTATPMFDWRPDGRLWRVVYGGSLFASELTWYWPNNVPVQVTYSHGWTTPPSEFKTIALELAAAAYSNPELMDRQRTGWVEGQTSNIGLSLTDAQRRKLDRYRRLDV